MDNLPAENYIKREREKRRANEKVIGHMRTSLPVYTMDEIREFKLPFYEALLIGLMEKRYYSTVSYLKELFEYQSKLRDQAGIGTIVWLRPQLILSRDQLQYLSDGLRTSEDHHHKGNHALECQNFIALAVHFAFDVSDWWWLGEQLLIQAIKVSKSYASLGGKYEALSRFTYGKFLIENVKEFVSALEQLKKARILAEGKGWSSKIFFPDESGTLFMQVNLHLFHCLYREAKYLLKIDINKALAVAVEARKRAADSCYHEGETKVLMLKGVCELESHDVKSAINSFVRAFQLEQKLHSIEGVCKVRIQLAKAYLMDDNAPKALETLMMLKEDAEKHKLPFYLGQAYKNLGEYYLISGEPEKANALLNEAMKIFRECQVEIPDVETVRDLEAISAGLELFPDYVKLIHQSGVNDTEGFRSLSKLVAWKDERIPFWNVEEKVQHHKSVSEIIGESVHTVSQDSEKGSKKNAVEMVARCSVPIAEEVVLSVSVDPKAVIELHDNRETFISESDYGLGSGVDNN